MQRIFAITWLTWKAAIRFRLFAVIAFLLLVSVVGLPLLIRDDGTARGFTQILLTYTLTAVSTLLGLCTLWLACGTLARDIEEGQAQVVAVKPIARWQIWLGKWLGLVSLNAVLLALSGASIYGMLLWRSTKLPAAERAILRQEVLVARGSAKERNLAKEINNYTDQELRRRLEKNPLSAADTVALRKQLREQIKTSLELALPDHLTRSWRIDLGAARHFLAGRPLQIRAKFNDADNPYPYGTYPGVWLVGVPQKTKTWQSPVMSLSADTFHEFEIQPDLFDDQGVLTICFANASKSVLLFPLEDGLEVLYPEGGFGPNFLRGLGIIFCWMTLLATLGLAGASFLSFPVAAFCCLGLLSIVLCSGTMANAVEEGTIVSYNAEKGEKGFTPADIIVIPAFRATLKVISLAKDFSPVDSLSSGRRITWTQLILAGGQIILLFGGFFGAIGIAAFSRRELAAAQGTQ